MEVLGGVKILRAVRVTPGQIAIVLMKRISARVSKCDGPAILTVPQFVTRMTLFKCVLIVYEIFFLFT